MKPKKELLRILRTETGEFVVDALGKANGRGAYLLPERRMLSESCEKPWIGTVV